MSFHFEREPLAIVGMGCRFPGAASPQAFWKLLCEGRDAITDFPKAPGRFDIEAFYDPRPATPGKMSMRQGGFLSDIDRFDYTFFGISPREASYLDPQIRVLLEIAWETLEDAGEVSETIAGSHTGVFIGSVYSEYLDLQLRDFSSMCMYSLSGSLRSMLSGRLSFALDLRGPSLTVDTACSSSLVALHLACQSIWTGESSMALAGGANIYLHPGHSIGYAQTSMLSFASRCKAFDAKADGLVRSEGAGIVLLKPLSQARVDKNPIYAVICGSAMSNDGQSGPFLFAPSQIGQEITFRKAYQCAGKDPAHVQYVEAHGPGTPVGDPIEVAALAAVLGEGRAPEDICYLGSVKSNMGHTEGAAGIAGFIKTVLCLKHRTLVPTVHFHTPNPAIAWQSTPFKVVEQVMPWPQTSGPALASVSSFGLSGTNAHVILEEVQEKPSPSSSQADGAGPVEILPLSAKTEAALFSMAESWQRWLFQRDEDVPALSDLCYTAAVRRTHHEYRLAMVGANREDMARQLDAFCKGESMTTLLSGRSIPDTAHKMVFVFSGYGSQWIGMGKQLLEQESLFRTTLEECEEAMRPYTDWSLIEELTAPESRSRRDCVQPMLFALQVALARLWISWGICPDAVVGHSLGEISAAHIAGILSLSDAARIACSRSILIERVRGRGAMVVVGLSLEQARQAVAGKEASVSVAVSNSPTSTVLSGDPLVLKELLTTFEEQDIFCRPIKDADAAGHSPHMDPLLEELEARLYGIKPQKASLPFYSTVTTRVVEGPECDEIYWVRNLREPVLFAPAIQRVLADGASLFLEISPHPLLTGAIQQCAPQKSPRILALPSLRRNEDERTMLLSTIGALYIAGYPIAWQQISPSGRCVSLPSYPWQREQCWFAPAESKTLSWEHTDTSRVRQDGKPAHPLLQRYLHLATSPGTYVWETDLDTRTFRYLNDHGTQESMLFPATAYIEMACAGAQEAFLLDTLSLEQIRFERVLFLSKDSPQRLQMVISRSTVDTADVQFFTFAEDEGEEAVRHASAVIHLHPLTQEGPSEPLQFDLAALAERCTREVTHAQHYQAIEDRAVHYGPSFKGVEQVWYGEGETLARVRVRPEIKQERANYILHPAFLDACLQAGFVAAIVTSNLTGAYLPDSVSAFSSTEFPGEECWVYSQQHLSADTNELITSVFLLNDVGQICAQVKGLHAQRIGAGAFGTVPVHEERASERLHDNTSLRQQLQQASDDERLALLETSVTGCFAKILGYSQTRIDQDMTLDRLGLDSLMSLEVRNTLARELEVSLPLADFFGKRSLRQVVQRLFETVG